jgi:ribosomal protein S18 acetylase RimI-like enzyme
MRQADLGDVAELTAAAFSRDLDDAGAADRWRERIAYPWRTDPDGAFVAELDGSVVGAAEAMIRERLWCLSMLAVRPGIQSAGAGRMLLEHAVAYGRPRDPGLIVSSNDPRALRLYAACGFSLIPTFAAAGAVDRRGLPRHETGVRADDGGDLESFDELTRTIRGAPYTHELPWALARGMQLLQLPGRGFALLGEEGRVWALVARDEDAGRALLCGALALADGHATVRWITGAQQWAIDVLLRARLKLEPHGALCVRGAPGPLWPFLPSAPFA